MTVWKAKGCGFSLARLQTRSRAAALFFSFGWVLPNRKWGAGGTISDGLLWGFGREKDQRVGLDGLRWSSRVEALDGVEMDYRSR